MNWSRRRTDGPERAAAIAIVGYAVILAAIRTWNEPHASGSVIGIVGFATAFGTPGLVAYVGAAGRQPAVMVGAAAALMPLALVAFSGVTLPLLLPALGLAYAAKRGPGGQPTSAGAVALGLALVVLLVGALVALLATTETVCWTTAESSGCDSGALSLGGSLVSLVLDGAAIALAWLASGAPDERGRDTPARTRPAPLV